MSQDTINICFASDENYAKYMGLSILSILNNARREDRFKFFVLSDSISEGSKNKVESLKEIKDFDIEWITLDMRVFEKYQKTKLPYTTYARLTIPEFIDEKKILYLDCDIFVRKSIATLYNEDLGSFYAGGVVDYCVKSRKWPSRLFLDDKDNSLYFNAGVLLINLELWKKNNVGQTLLEDCSKNSYRYRYADQDAINVVLRSGIKSIDPRWNVMDYFYSRDLFLKEDILEKLDNIILDPYIRHFKGWKKNSLYPNRDEYIKLMLNSPWKDAVEFDDPKWIVCIQKFFEYMWRHPFCFLLPRFYKRLYYRGFVGVVRS